MKRVLFLSNHLRGPNGTAGARSWHQVKRLSEEHHVDVIIPGTDPVSSQPVSRSDYDGLDMSLVSVTHADGTANRRESKVSRALYMVTTAFNQLLLALRSPKPSVVLSMGLPLPTLATAWLVSRIRRVPLVLDVRDIPFESAIELDYLSDGVPTRVLIAVENWLLSQAAHICTNSPRYVDILQEKGVEEKSITVAPIGFDNFNPNPQPAVLDIPVADAKLRFLYAGTIGFAFPLDDIVRAAAASKVTDQIELRFFGDGQQLTELVELSKRLGVHAKFEGRVPKATVMEAILHTDFCLYSGVSGRYSGAILGNKIFDYLGNGKPVLCVGEDLAVGDFLLRANAGIVVPAEVEEIANAFEELVQSASLASDLSTAATAFQGHCPTAGSSAEILADVLRRQLL